MSVQAAVFNASGAFARKPFLELTEEEFEKGWAVTGRGAFLFAQATLPLLLKGVEASSKHPPTLIFTGATASVKGSALFGGFAAPKWAARGLTQSLAREFFPKGVHVAHAVIDGVIDIPRTKEWMKDAGPDAKISADGVSLSPSTIPTLHAVRSSHVADCGRVLESPYAAQIILHVGDRHQALGREVVRTSQVTKGAKVLPHTQYAL